MSSRLVDAPLALFDEDVDAGKTFALDRMLVVVCIYMRLFRTKPNVESHNDARILASFAPDPDIVRIF